MLTISVVPSSFVDARSKHLKIMTMMQEPFMFELTDLNNNSKKLGLVKHILDVLSAQMNFTYELHLPPDGNYGAPDDQGFWNGMVGEVIYGRADMIAADLTVNAPRSQIMSFSVPYMNLDLGFVYKKPMVKFHLFAFLMPFSPIVWIVIFGSLFLAAMTLFLFEKINDRGDPLENLASCFYFGLACLFAQGPETYPKSVFSRAIAISWWFFSLMILTLYTATLTSIMTVNRSHLSIKSIEDLLNHESYHYGIEPGNIVQHIFEHSEYAPFQIMWSEMITRKEDSFFEQKEGLKKVRESENFAFIRESPYLLYDITLLPCNLELVVNSNSPKTGSGFAFGFQKDSPLATDFSVEMLKIFANGKMAAIHHKWFTARSQCSEKHTLSSIDTIHFEEVCGIFYTFLGGMVLSAVFFIVKKTHQIWKQNRKLTIIRVVESMPSNESPQADEERMRKNTPGCDHKTTVIGCQSKARLDDDQLRANKKELSNSQAKNQERKRKDSSSNATMVSQIESF